LLLGMGHGLNYVLMRDVFRCTRLYVGPLWHQVKMALWCVVGWLVLKD